MTPITQSTRRMKERPILFSSPMVKAILEGRKTQTRRLVKDPAHHGCMTGDCPHELQVDCNTALMLYAASESPYGCQGDHLWVRETFAAPWGLDYKFPSGESGILYRADNPTKFPDDGTWKPSIFMPRSASRITLEITGVRVERLKDISNEDVIKEGVNMGPPLDADMPDSFDSLFKWRYCKLWESINGAGSWALNPFVWIIEFKKL